jgi:hypothetical protein
LNPAGATNAIFRLVPAAAAVVNLKLLRPSRKRLAAGDIFVMLPPDGKYLFGRVISTEARAGPSMPGPNHLAGRVSYFASTSSMTAGSGGALFGSRRASSLNMPSRPPTLSI